MGNQQQELNWPPLTQLVLDGDCFLLTKQSPTIRTLLSKTFSEVKALLIIENAFPDSIQHDAMIKKAMRTVVKELGSDFSLIWTCLKHDVNYVSILTFPVCHRSVSNALLNTTLCGLMIRSLSSVPT
jgi:hypothetical protein